MDATLSAGWLTSRFRRWVLANYPFTNETAAELISRYPMRAVMLAYMLPTAARRLLLRQKSLGLRALAEHPAAFTAGQIRRFATRHNVNTATLPAGARRIAGLPPFADAVRREMMRVAKTTPLVLVAGDAILVIRDVGAVSAMFASAQQMRQLCRNRVTRNGANWIMYHVNTTAFNSIRDTVLEVGPALPEYMLKPCATALGFAITKGEPHDTRIKIAARFPSPGYWYFVRILASGPVEYTRNAIAKALRYQLRGAQLPPAVCRVLLPKYADVLLELHEDHYLRLSPRALLKARAGRLCDTLRDVV